MSARRLRALAAVGAVALLGGGLSGGLGAPALAADGDAVPLTGSAEGDSEGVAPPRAPSVSASATGEGAFRATWGASPGATNHVASWSGPASGNRSASCNDSVCVVTVSGLPGGSYRVTATESNSLGSSSGSTSVTVEGPAPEEPDEPAPAPTTPAPDAGAGGGGTGGAGAGGGETPAAGGSGSPSGTPGASGSPSSPAGAPAPGGAGTAVNPLPLGGAPRVLPERQAPSVTLRPQTAAGADAALPNGASQAPLVAGGEYAPFLPYGDQDGETVLQSTDATPVSAGLGGELSEFLSSEDLARHLAGGLLLVLLAAHLFRLARARVDVLAEGDL